MQLSSIVQALSDFCRFGLNLIDWFCQAKIGGDKRNQHQERCEINQRCSLLLNTATISCTRVCCEHHQSLDLRSSSRDPWSSHTVRTTPITSGSSTRADHAKQPAKALEVAKREVAHRHDVYALDSYAWPDCSAVPGEKSCPMTNYEIWRRKH